MAYRSDEGSALAILEAALLTCGFAYTALVNDIYIGSPTWPDSLASAWARVSLQDFDHFVFIVPFAFMAVWPLAIFGGLLTMEIAGKVKSWALPLVMMPFAVAALMLATILFGLTLQDPAILAINGAILGAMLGLLARILMVLQAS